MRFGNLGMKISKVFLVEILTRSHSMKKILFSDILLWKKKHFQCKFAKFFQGFWILAVYCQTLLDPKICFTSSILFISIINFKYPPLIPLSFPKTRRGGGGGDQGASKINYTDYRSSELDCLPTQVLIYERFS